MPGRRPSVNQISQISLWPHCSDNKKEWLELHLCGTQTELLSTLGHIRYRQRWRRCADTSYKLSPSFSHRTFQKQLRRRRRLTWRKLCIKFSLLNFWNVKRPEPAKVMTPCVESDDAVPPCVLLVGKSQLCMTISTLLLDVLCAILRSSSSSHVDILYPRSGRTSPPLVCGKKFVVCSLIALFM